MLKFGKISLMFVLVILTNSATAVQPSACLKKIAEAQKWDAITPEQIDCMAKSDGFADSMSYLCSKNQANVSAKYHVYLSYMAEYEQAMQEVRAANDDLSRVVAFHHVDRVEQDWMVGGYHSEVDGHLNVVESAKFFCDPNK